MVLHMLMPARDDRAGRTDACRVDAARRRALQAALAGSMTGALACWPGRARADLPALVASSRASVLPVGSFDPLANPRFGFRGSGFVVGEGNLVVTNAHVLPEPGTLPTPQLAVLVQAPSAGGAAAPAAAPTEIRRATLLHADRARDLAVLRIEGPALPALPLAGADAVREGMDIALMGFPIGGVFGFSMVTHRGIVASITRIALPSPTSRQLDPRAVAQLREGPFEVYQLDATAYPGNSGGPVLDPRTGAVVGVVNMVLVRGTRESALSQPTGISYAIPVRFVRELLAR
jgi:S1-C subfamily serine protease